jgi:hypothetical protein
MRKRKRAIYILLCLYVLKEAVMQHNFNDCQKIDSSQHHLRFSIDLIVPGIHYKRKIRIIFLGLLSSI